MCDARELFNLSEKSTLQELKNAYFEMALYAHPDRGGSCDQMCALQNAYKVAKAEIETKRHFDTVTGATDLHLLHCELVKEIDQNAIPSFIDIYDETHDTALKFKMAWEKADNVELSSEDWGYGDLMIPSEYHNQEFNLEYQPFVTLDKEINGLNANFELSIVPKDNFDSMDSFQNSKSLIKGEPQESLNDYAQALGAPTVLSEKLPKEIFDHYKNNGNVIEMFNDAKLIRQEHTT